MPVVAVDIKTRQVTFLDYVAVHDCATMVNPMTVDGHVRGSTAHGIGTALLEQFEYDKDGQPQQISFQDYPMPRVLNLPPAGANRPFGDIVALYGVKGAGRGRPHGGAVACAIEDALRPLGVRIDSLPITPARLRSLIREKASDSRCCVTAQKFDELAVLSQELPGLNQELELRVADRVGEMHWRGSEEHCPSECQPRDLRVAFGRFQKSD